MSRKRIVTLFLALALVLTCAIPAVSLAEATANTEPVTLTWFYNFSYQDVEWGKDAISQEVTRRTGITLDMSEAKTSDNEQLNLMLSSDDLTDLVCMDTDNPIRYSVQRSGLVEDLMPLMQQYQPEMIATMGDNYWKYWADEDGKNYNYANCTFTEKTTPKYVAVGPWNPCSLVRSDIYEALGKPDMSTPELLKEVLLKVKEQYPDAMPFYTGESLANFGIASGCANMGYVQRLFGNRLYYEDETGRMNASYKNPNYLTFLKWMNELYNAGIITREGFAITTEQNDAIRQQGTPFFWTGGFSEAGYVPSGKPDVHYEIVAPFETLQMVQQTGMSWMSTFISTKSEKKDRAIQFLAFVSSDEGDQLLQWGIEGRDWVMDDGVAIVPPETMTARQTDWTKYRTESGYRMYNFGINFADHVIENNVFMRDPVLKAGYDLYKGKCFVKLDELSLTPDAESEAGIIYQQCNDEFKAIFPNIIMAKDAAEVETMFNDMVAKFEGMGIGKVEDHWTARAERTRGIYGAENMISYGSQPLN